MKKVAGLILVFGLLAVNMPVYASESNACTWAESKSWGVSAPGKLVRGVMNLGLGWTNIFVQPFKEDTVMNGFGKGLAFFAVRTVQGLGEILLFWLPPVPDEPLHECVLYDWGTLPHS